MKAGWLAQEAGGSGHRGTAGFGLLGTFRALCSALGGLGGTQEGELDRGTRAGTRHLRQRRRAFGAAPLLCCRGAGDKIGLHRA